MRSSRPRSGSVWPAARVLSVAALACACATAPARAQSGIRISEVFFACANGDTTVQYVELENTGVDTVFTGTLRLAYLRDPDTGQFSIAVGSAIAGSAWPQGGHYLVASSSFGSKLGLTPDFTNSQVKLSRKNGIFTLYDLDAGVKIIRDDIRYGPFGATATPPDGYGLGYILGFRLPALATPQRRDGAVPGTSSCFAAGSLGGDFVLTEAMLRCPSGLVPGQFMEVTALDYARETTADVGLRYFDRDDHLLADVPGVFGAGIGRGLEVGRSWLLAPLSSTVLGSVDGTFSVPLDTTGGRIVLYRARAGDDSILTELRYGVPGGVPLPAPGSSLAWNPVTKTFAVTPNPSPMDHAGVIHAIALDCMGPPVSSARISELQIRCTDGNPEGRFLELQPTSAPDQFDRSLNIAVFDHHGGLVGVQGDLFGARTGNPWPITGRWLLATTLFSDPAGRPADGALSLALDPLGGRIELRARRHVDDVEVVVEAISYGTSEIPAPPPGQSLVRSSSGTFSVSAVPQPQGFSGATYTTPATCRQPGISSARISELQIRCTDGGLDGRFVELEPSKTPDTLDSTLAVVVYDHAGALIGEIGALFGARTGQLWPAASHWLLATEAFSSPSAADSPFPIHPDTLGGRIELRARSRIDGSLAVVDVVSYGPGAAPVPPPGQSLVRSSSGVFLVAPRPGPQGFAGTLYLAALECRRPRISSVRIGELSLRCQGGSTAYQFVELAPLAQDDVLEPGLTLRAFDANHMLLGEIADVFGTRAGGEFPASGPWFVGSPSWRNAVGAGPETSLPFTLDRRGGSIELAGHDRVTGEPVALQTLEYGTGGLATPGPGKSLVRSPDGAYTVAVSSPRGSGGTAFVPGPECAGQAVVSAFVQQFSLACSSGAVAGQYIDIDVSAPGDVLDSSLVVQAYDPSDHLLGTIHVLADSWWAGSPYSRRSFATRFWQYESGYGWGYLNDALLPFVLDPNAGRIVLTARDRIFGDTVVVDEVRYGPAGVPAPAPGTGLVRTPDRTYSVTTTPEPHPAWVDYSFRAFNKGCEPARMDEIFTACREGAPDVSYVRMGAHTSYNYVLRPAPLEGDELRAWGADGALRLVDTVLVGAPYSGPIGDHSYLATSPGFTTEFGTAGDRTLHGTLDPSGGRIALGWTTPAGAFETFDELVYGPGGVPAPAPGRALVRDDNGAWNDNSPSAATSDGRTFSSASCFDTSPWPVVFQEVFPSCRCYENASFIELTALDGATLFERGITLVALDRLGAERWRAPNVFSARAGLPWPAGRTYLMASVAAISRLLGGNTPNAVLPGSLDADGGRVLLLREPASAPPETLASFAYGPGTPNQRSLQGWSYQRQPDESYVQGYPSPTAFGNTTPWVDPNSGPLCIGTGANALIEQALWSCLDGSGGVAYIGFKATLGNFPDDMGVKAFGRDGVQLFRLEHPFAGSGCLPIPSGGTSRWLLATAALEELCGSGADGRMPVPLDPVAGRIETFLVTPTGEVTVQAFYYGGASGLVVPPGYAGQPGNPGKAVDARPIRSDGRVLRAASCIEDGAPSVTINEVLLRCGDGGLEAQYVKLVGGGQPDFHDSRLRLLALDHTGAEKFRLEPLAPALEGRPTPAGQGLLLGGPSLVSRTGLAPDAEFAQPLDPSGGTLRLEWMRATGATPVVLDQVRYGPGTPLPLPIAGMALRPHDEVRTALRYLALPFNLAGERPASRACFVDSCSAFSMNGHLAYPDSTRGTYRDCYSYSCSIISYDWTQLSVSAYAAARYDASSEVNADDDFVAEGLPLGTPVSFNLRFDADLYGSYYGGCSDPFCRDAYMSVATASLSVAGVLVQLPSVTWTLDTTVTRPVTVRAGEPFRLSLAASTWAQTEDGIGGASGSVRASLVPMDLPPGVRLRSCWGYVTPGVVAADVSLATASATRDAVRLEWRTSLGSAFSAQLERRTEDSPWLPLATLFPDGVGALKFEDRDVHLGRTYDYRLRWSGGERTSDVVTLRIPDAPSFAFRGAYPNPVRDAFSLSVVLEDGGGARLEIFDVTGRRVASQALALEPGEHVVPITVANRLPPGIYSLKLRQGAHSAIRRLVVLP